MYNVKNIGTTLQILYDKGGKKISLNKGESKLMVHPPEDSYQFKVTKTEETEEKEEPKTKKEVK